MFIPIHCQICHNVFYQVCMICLRYHTIQLSANILTAIVVTLNVYFALDLFTHYIIYYVLGYALINSGILIYLKNRLYHEDNVGHNLVFRLAILSTLLYSVTFPFLGLGSGQYFVTMVVLTLNMNFNLVAIYLLAIKFYLV